MNRNPKKQPTPYTAQDFMPEEPKTPAERQADLQARINAAMFAVGGKQKETRSDGTIQRRRKPPHQTRA